MDYLHQFTFGIYPYLAMVIFLLGSLIRFEREQYSWKSESSQVLHMGALRLGNILFHVGILGLFFGHLVGLLTPVAVWDALGVTHTAKQIFAMVAGGIMGLMCLLGLLILLFRRFSNARLAKNTTWRSGLLRAICSASCVAYTMRTSPPRARAFISDKPPLAGTRKVSA